MKHTFFLELDCALFMVKSYHPILTCKWHSWCMSFEISIFGQISWFDGYVV